MHPDTSGLLEDLEWLELVAQLRPHKTDLVHDFIARFDGTVVYEGYVSREEIHALVASTMDMYLALLSGQRLEPELAQLPVNLGRRRARQGVTAELLLEGVRTNTLVFWNALQTLASETGAEACLVRNTKTVLALVEWHVREVQRAFLAEEGALLRDRERRERIAVARLFEEAALSSEDLAALASTLGLQADEPILVTAQLGSHQLDCAVCPSVPERSFVHEVAGGTHHFFPAAHGGVARGAAVAVAGPVAGIARVREAAETALTVARSPAARGGKAPLTPETAWPAIAWAALTETVPAAYLPIATAGLADLPADRRERLVETLTVYFDTGSIKTTAERLFCHRNTIVKRLALFESLTGVDLSRPREAALAVLALSSAA